MLVFAHVSTQREKEADSSGKVKYRGISTWTEYSHVAMVTHFLQVRQTLIAIPNHFQSYYTVSDQIRSKGAKLDWKGETCVVLIKNTLSLLVPSRSRVFPPCCLLRKNKFYALKDEHYQEQDVSTISRTCLVIFYIPHFHKKIPSIDPKQQWMYSTIAWVFPSLIHRFWRTPVVDALHCHEPTHSH